MFFGHQNLVAINETGCVSSCNCRFPGDWLPCQYPKASVGGPPKIWGSPWVAGQGARWVWGLLNLAPSSCVLWGIKQGGTRADRQTAPWTLCLVKSQGADPCGDTGTSPLLSAGLGGWLEPRCGKSPGGITCQTALGWCRSDRHPLPFVLWSAPLALDPLADAGAPGGEPKTHPGPGTRRELQRQRLRLNGQ